MNDPRHRLLARFRATLVERLRTTLAALETLETDPASEDTIKRELHTFKGETRMLGLTTQSDSAHAIEERLPALFAKGNPSAKSVQAEIETAILHLLRSLDEKPNGRPPEPSNGVPVPAPADEPAAAIPVVTVQPMAPERERGPDAASVERTTRRGRFAQVESAAVDRLCLRLAELSSTFLALNARAKRSTSDKADETHREHLAGILEQMEHCQGLLDECTEEAWALRLMPVEPTLRELASHAERLARSVGKKITVVVQAVGVHLESDVLDQLWESLLHIVQNAVEHGIEDPSERGAKSLTARIVIAAETQGPSVVLCVEDDGRGIDVDRVIAAAVEKGLVSNNAGALDETEVLELLCQQGFSTARKVSVLSGRGVGLDVVRSRVEGLGGTLRLETRLGGGTRFLLKVPFAVTKERLLVLSVGDIRVGFPARLVAGVVRLSDSSASHDADRNTIRYEGSAIPLRSASALVGAPRQDEPHAVVLELASRLWALSFPAIVGERDLIRTPADPLLTRTSLFGATACLDDGALVLIPQLDRFHRLLRRESMVDRSRAQTRRARRVRVLVVDDSPVVRDLVSEVLTTAGLDVVLAQDGAEGIQRVESSDLDLVLSDVEMPRMDGFALLQEIRNRTQRLPVIMLTTRGSLEDRKRATALGANAYLTKAEFRGATLLDTVGRFVDLHP